jgi:hypothetical protein
MAMMIDGGVLVVKVSPDFSGRIVEGRLVPLPEEFRASGEAMTDAASGAASTPAVIHPG